MVRVAGSTGATFCIDTTEVTNLQYAAFATTNLPATTMQPAACAWNGSFIQSSIPDLIGHGDNPAAFVDWCDANAYCAWAGKRLCGKIGGGATASNEADDASVSQWYAACTAAGTRVFPYGATYALTLCTGEKSGSDFTTPVTTATCVGGSPGLFDMSGNVAEWSDACVPAATPDKDLCELRGGGGLDVQAGLRCDAFRAEKRNAALKDVGFRCCSL
jgi:formylglycine-generating enzyme required for sulfatase activity